MVKLKEHQKKALYDMKNGCILHGGVGSGKSITSIAYYFYRLCKANPNEHPKDLYIITTAQKRNKKEWNIDLGYFGLNPDCNEYSNVKITIDSWNNIKKYKNIKDAFFIFDEQRLVGYGTWSRTFIYISKHNGWVLLSATPGDSWSDYISVFIANGFYSSKKEFEQKHCVFNPYTNFPSIMRYEHIQNLERYKSYILVEMPFERNTVRHHEYVTCHYDRFAYKRVQKDRWDIFKNEPYLNAGAMFLGMRRVVNGDESRALESMRIMHNHLKCIIFYNFNYELEALKKALENEGFDYAEYNGQKHESIPTGNTWAYLVQYNAGAEGWNCITANTIIFYSQNYSYRMTEQASGRIDRMNTPYKDLYYYHLVSDSWIDLAIKRALSKKKDFNERKYKW